MRRSACVACVGRGRGRAPVPTGRAGVEHCDRRPVEGNGLAVDHEAGDAERVVGDGRPTWPQVEHAHRVCRGRDEACRRQRERAAWEVEAEAGHFCLLEQRRPDAREPALGEAEEDGPAAALADVRPHHTKSYVVHGEGVSQIKTANAPLNANILAAVQLVGVGQARRADTAAIATPYAASVGVARPVDEHKRRAGVHHGSEQLPVDPVCDAVSSAAEGERHTQNRSHVRSCRKLRPRCQ
eukprot:scaffold31755_cov90-Isochrysis_galbana.AAC.1